MLTQLENDFPLSAAHSRQAFKLLELPPELLSLLETDEPPTLSITSSNPPSSSDSTVSSIPTYAILNSGAKQYQMRQKNTSNPITILHPSTARLGEGEDVDTSVPISSLVAIAQVDDTIELVLLEESDDGRGDDKTKKINKWHEKFAKGRPLGKRA